MSAAEFEHFAPGGDGEGAPAARYPFWDFRDLVAMLVLTLPALASGFLLAWGLFQFVPHHPAGRALQVLAAQFLFWGIWFLALKGLFKARYGRPFWRSLAWVAPPDGFGRYAALGFLTAGFVIVLGVLLRPPKVEMPLMELLRDPVAVAVVGVFAVTLGPLCEELAFRGFLLPWLIRVVRVVPAIVLTSLMFAMLHGPEYAWSWQHVALITLAGGAFGWVRYRTGSTAAATVMHATYNLVFFLALVAQHAQGIKPR